MTRYFRALAILFTALLVVVVLAVPGRDPPTSSSEGPDSLVLAPATKSAAEQATAAASPTHRSGATEPPAVSDTRQALRQAALEDQAKSRFRGELGPFAVVGPGTDQSNVGCPQGFRPGPGDGHNTQDPITDLHRSELFFTLPGAQVDAVGACGDRVVNVRQLVAGGVVGRSYFEGPSLLVFFDAPQDRLRLSAVGGRPALEELPIPGNLASYTRLIVIERPPEGTAPGIFVWVDTRGSPDTAREVIEAIWRAR